jgi:hypothetical protein
MRGTSAEDVAAKVLACEALQGLQGPTVSPVYTHSGSDNGSGQPQVRSKLWLVEMSATPLSNNAHDNGSAFLS